jgi:response regulator RpfG family c-di-GMP phosphodiesterase
MTMVVDILAGTALVVHRLGRPEGEAELIRSAALLHESGRALLAAGGLAIHRDWETDHPMMDEDVARHGRFLAELVEILRHHHEHWDDGGAPDGLKGEEIPLLARVLNVAEAFEILIRGGSSPLEAVDRLGEDSGKAYDPTILEALARFVGEGERLVAILRTPPIRVPRPVEAAAKP